MAEIFYLRHGQASVLSNNYDQLSELGEKQSFLTGRHFSLKSVKFDRVYYGPLKRHKQTLDAFISGYESAGEKLNAHVKILDSLEEHQGFKVIKKVTPHLIQNDEEVRHFASLPFENRAQQIKNYFRVYEIISMKWAKEELDGLADPFESWQAFRKRSASALDQIKSETETGKSIAVITSGGPISMAIADTLHLSNEKAMEISWAIHNCSVTSFLKGRGRFSLSSFNATQHFEDAGMVTLV